MKKDGIKPVYLTGSKIDPATSAYLMRVPNTTAYVYSVTREGEEIVREVWGCRTPTHAFERFNERVQLDRLTL